MFVLAPEQHEMVRDFLSSYSFTLLNNFPERGSVVYINKNVFDKT